VYKLLVKRRVNINKKSLNYFLFIIFFPIFRISQVVIYFTQQMYKRNVHM